MDWKTGMDGKRRLRLWSRIENVWMCLSKKWNIKIFETSKVSKTKNQNLEDPKDYFFKLETSTKNSNKQNTKPFLWGCDASWFDGCHQSTVGTSGRKKMCKGKQIRWTMLRNMSFQKVNSTFSVFFFSFFFFNLADFEKGIFFHSETQRFCVSIEPRSFKLWVLRRRWTAMTLNGMLPPRRSHRSFSWPKRWKTLTKQRQQMQRQPISLPQIFNERKL